MAISPALDQRPVTDETTGRPGRASNRTTSTAFGWCCWRCSSCCSLASVAAVAYLGATRPVPALGIDGDQAAVQTQRESVMAQTEQFMLRINTYGPDRLDDDGTMPDYRKLVEAVITPKFAADFEKNAPLAEADREAGRAGAHRTGVQHRRLGDRLRLGHRAGGRLDHAVATRRSPAPTKRVQTEPAPFRVQVNLVKINGTWLVDDFQPLTGTDDQGTGAGTGTGTGLPTPTQEATP